MTRNDETMVVVKVQMFVWLNCIELFKSEIFLCIIPSEKKRFMRLAKYVCMYVPRESIKTLGI